VLFSGWFLLLANSYGNSVTFAKHVMLAASPSTSMSTELDSRLIRFIAIVVLAFVCLLHYFSGRFGLFMNKLLAIFKVLLLTTVIIAGVNSSNKPGSGLKDFKESHGKKNSADGLAAMVLILYAYSGYENANYVGQLSKLALSKLTLTPQRLPARSGFRERARHHFEPLDLEHFLPCLLSPFCIS
jgi:amino acid transporter